jgi:nitrate/nitrite transporter NarK
MAIANMAGNLAALACPIAVGAVLDASGGRWDLVLWMLASVALAGSLCWVYLDPRRADASAEPGSA